MPTLPDALIQQAAVRWGLDPALLHAVDIAEGNLLKAVQCSTQGVTTNEEALEITCRSAVHALCDFLAEGAAPEFFKVVYDGLKHAEPVLLVTAMGAFVKRTRPRAFVQFWAKRWAPIGAANDPHSLNVHWPENVLRAWVGR